MSFNSAVYDYERNETMNSGKHFKRKTMVTAYESDYIETPVVETPVDPDLLYWWDFSKDNYTQEQISKNPMFQLYESTGAAFRPQVVDIYENKGVKAGIGSSGNNPYIECNNNGQPFPIGTFDHFNPDNLTFVYEYSVEGGFDVFNNISNRATALFIEPSMLYNFGTVASSTDRDDPSMPSGLSCVINCKDLRQFRRAMNTDDTEPIQIYSHRPNGDYFYQANGYAAHGHDTMPTQGLFPYCVNGDNHKHAFGYRTKDGNRYFFYYKNKQYYEVSMEGTKTHWNRHLPLVQFRERENVANMVLKSIKIYNRFLEVDEFPNKTDRFPFLYHFMALISYTYALLSSERVLGPNYLQYANFTVNLAVYSRIASVGLEDMNVNNMIWYEYDLELLSSTSTFGIEFFNNYSNSGYTDKTKNYFQSTYKGICFGVDGDQFIKYKCGTNTIVTTTSTFPLNTRKFLSFAFTSTDVKFYYDKELIGTVLRSNDSSLWTWIESQPSTNKTRFGVFNLTASNNRAHFIVTHSFTEDRGTLDNTVL